MSKALIVIDVPDHLDITQFKVDCKLINKVYINYPSMDNKLLDLKPIPKEQHAKWIWGDDDFQRGWNACIDKILGGENEHNNKKD